MDGALKFTDLPLTASVQASLQACGFYVPSPIQAKALPIALFGNDLIAQAKSGMGKTLVFACVTLELVLANPTSWALILAPTREIALQIQHVLHTLIAAIPSLSSSAVVACIGGLDIQDDERRLQQRTTRVVVGTPGRVKALVQRKAIPMTYMHLFVLDEVDKLMESDFQSDLDAIVTKLPATKQIVACSATFTPDQLARLGTIMLTPQFVRVQGPQSVTTEYIQDTNVAAWKARDESQRPELWLRGVRQYYLVVDTPTNPDDLLRTKVQRLAHVLTEVPFHQCIVFCNDKYRAEALADALTSLAYPAVCITGAQAQSQRTESMDSFRQFQARILVSTDLTARGIDVDRVNFVVNLDLPRDPATYLHRVGRSGRFGGQGVAITLLGIPEVKAIKAMANVFKMTVAEWTGQAPPRDEQSREDDDTAYAHSDLPTRIFQRRQQNDKDGEQLDATMTLTPDTTTLPKFSSLHVDTPANFQHESPRLVVAPSPQATTDATPLNSSPTFPPEINVGSPCAAAATSVARKRPSKSKRPPTSPPPTIVTNVDLRNQPTSLHIQRDVSSPQPKPPTKQNHFNNATYLKEEAMYDQWLALVHKSSQS